VSTLSLIEVDQSDRLAKRFAHLASTYFDRPEEAKAPAARIPLENLFRILQMLRYDAFSDEPRSGVLDLRSLNTQALPSVVEGQWHDRIKKALNESIDVAFSGTAKEAAIDQIQSVLRWLATTENAPSAEIRAKAKQFFERLDAFLN
jgi:hypothetical protein